MDEYHWTPEQIDRMEPEFIAELVAYRAARSDHQLFTSEDDPQKREAKRKEIVVRRKAEIVRMRDRNSRGKRSKT